MARKKAPREPDDDLEALSIRKKRNPALLFGVLVAAIVLVLLACTIGSVIVGILVWSDHSNASKLNGSWKGRFVIAGRQLDVIYSFGNDGSFREEEVDQIGRKVRVSEGRWTLRKNEVEITWNNGASEKASLHWIDNNTIDYRIIEHTELIQVGAATTFKRK